jgi:hypothetical protein
MDLRTSRVMAKSKCATKPPKQSSRPESLTLKRLLKAAEQPRTQQAHTGEVVHRVKNLRAPRGGFSYSRSQDYRGD